jgi:hypothetical protein
MNLSAIFIRRPVATTLLTIGIALSGALAFTRMPVAPLPNISFPTIQVMAQMAGASPETMAQTVAEPLERHLGIIADVTEMTSQSGVGTPASRCNSGWTATSMALPAMSKRRSRRRARICRPPCGPIRPITNSIRPRRRS